MVAHDPRTSGAGLLESLAWMQVPARERSDAHAGGGRLGHVGSPGPGRRSPRARQRRRVAVHRRARGYLTGSNSAANAMLAAPQAQIATTLELSQLPAMAVHNVASSLLLMGTPAKVELAAQLRPNAKIGCLAEPRVLLVDLTMVVCLAALLVLATVR